MTGASKASSSSFPTQWRPLQPRILKYESPPRAESPAAKVSNFVKSDRTAVISSLSSSSSSSSSTSSTSSEKEKNSEKKKTKVDRICRYSQKPLCQLVSQTDATVYKCTYAPKEQKRNRWRRKRIWGGKLTPVHSKSRIDDWTILTAAKRGPTSD